MISSAVRELGESFRYENLVYWAKLKNIDEENVKKELKELVKNKLLKVFFEIRCPECGAISATTKTWMKYLGKLHV